MKWSALLLALSGMSCGGHMHLMSGEQDLVRAEGVYALVNLHPDPGRSRLYAVNYQQDGLIKRCTPVTLLALNRKRLVFTAGNDPAKYSYYWHKAAGEPWTDHLLRYFGTSCDPDEVEKLSSADQRGVAEGRVAIGMTRPAVFMAIGYPPLHHTPDLNGTRHKYMRNRFKSFVVVYDDKGVVTDIEGLGGAATERNASQ